MALWDDFLTTIRRGWDQLNPFDGGRDWNTIPNERKKKKEEEQQRPAVQQPQVQAPAPNFNFQQPNQQKPQLANFDQSKTLEQAKQNFGQVGTDFQKTNRFGNFNNQLPDELLTPVQKQAKLQQQNPQNISKDGTVRDNRPFPARTFSYDDANKALKIAKIAGGTNNPASALRMELSKPQPSKSVVQSLTKQVRQQATKEINRPAPGLNIGDIGAEIIKAPFKLVNDFIVQPTGEHIADAWQANTQRNEASQQVKDRTGRSSLYGDPKMQAFQRESINLALRDGSITPERHAELMADFNKKAAVADAVIKDVRAESKAKWGTEVPTQSEVFWKTALPTVEVGTLGGGGALMSGGRAIGGKVLPWVTKQAEKTLGRTLTKEEAIMASNKARELEKQLVEKSADSLQPKIEKKPNTPTDPAIEAEENLRKASETPNKTIPELLNEQTPESTQMGARPLEQPSTRSTQSIASIMDGIVGRDATAAREQFDFGKYGVKKETYDELAAKYGKNEVETLIASSADATNIRSQDAFVKSQARKLWGGKVRTRQSVQAELDQAAAKQDQMLMKQGNPETRQTVTLDDGRVIDAKTGEMVDAPVIDMPQVGAIEQLSKNAKNSLENDTTGIKPGGVERSGGFVENGTAKPIEVRTLDDGSQVIVDGRHTLEYARQNGITDYPIKDVTSQYSRDGLKPNAEVVDSNLGSMADTFYQSKAGDQKINFRDIENLGKNIAAEADRSFKAVNSDFATVARKTQENQANGKAWNDGLSQAETRVWDNVQREFDYIRRRASVGRKEIGQGDQGQGYFPHQTEGQYDTRASLLEGFLQSKPGNEFRRKSEGGLGLDEIDYSPNVLAQYVTRYADTKLLNNERIARAIQKNNPDVDEKTVVKATKQVTDLQDKINTLKTKINLGGLGKKTTVSTGKAIDSAAELSKVGKTLGREQIKISSAGKGFTNGERINSVDIDGKPLGDVIGLNQYRDAGSYAGTQLRAADGDREALVGQVFDRLKNDYNLPDEEISRLVEGINRVKADVPDEVLHARVASTYSTAAKQQMMEQLQNIDITNPKLRKDVSDLTNQILREGSIEQELSSKIVSKTLQTTNALFRKLNVSSALNELSDLTSFNTVFGKDMAYGMARPDYSKIRAYNLGEIDPAIEPYIRQVSEGADVKSVVKALKATNEATNLYRFVEHYKAASFLTAAERHYTKKGLSGDALTKQILDDYRQMALPQDAFTKTFLNDYPLYTQYMSWGARNLQKEYRLATGKVSTGVMSDKSQAARIARNAYANIPAKTAFWLASNGLKGTGIMTAFGLTDFTGLTSQDYSGIQEEDKSLYDRTTQFTNTSTVFSLLNTVVQAYEKEQLKQKYKDEDYNPYEHANLGDSLVNTFTPQVLKNATGANDMMNKGYSENAAGRVQYEAPDDPYNIVKAYLFGKGQTDNAREYSGRQDVITRMNNGKDPISAVADMAKEQLGLQDTQYNRPLTEDYSKEFKARQNEARTALLQGGRQYNKYLDNLQKNSPEDYNRYIASMDGNHVQPEYWREIAGSKDDLNTFKMIANRKKQLQKDLGTKYDPTYDLPDDQARSILKLKSSPTGDDIALRNALNKEKWYQDYKKAVSKYYDGKQDAGGSEFKETQRVKEWNALDDQLNSFYYKKGDPAPAWAKQYPLLYQQKNLEFGSPESDAFFKGNYDGWAAEKAAYQKSQLAIINKMRKIEGYPPMSEEQYEQANAYADTDEDGKSGKRKGYVRTRGGRSGYSRNSSSSRSGASTKTNLNQASFGSGGSVSYTPIITKTAMKNIKRPVKTKGGKAGKIAFKRSKS